MGLTLNARKLFIWLLFYIGHIYRVFMEESVTIQEKFFKFNHIDITKIQNERRCTFIYLQVNVKIKRNL